jgi:hypothetical protein
MKTNLKALAERLKNVEKNWEKLDKELLRMKVRCDLLCHVNPEQVEAYKERMIPMLEQWMTLDVLRIELRGKLVKGYGKVV